MLIEFSVKNYQSFWNTQKLSMAAGSTKELANENKFASPINGLPELLRSAVVYGANGSGKSNLIKAISFMREFVLNSSKESQEKEKIKRKPFLFNSNGPSNDSEFEIVFVQDSIRYQYGFSVTDTRVSHEWLFAYPGNKPQRWFERSFNPETKNEDWYFGTKLSGSKKTWQTTTRSNALFLSTAVQLNSEQLQPVYHWFQNLIVIRHDDIIANFYTAENCADEDQYHNIKKFINDAGINVDEIFIKDKKLNIDHLPADMPEPLKKIILNDIEGETIKEVFFQYKLKDSNDYVSLPLEAESDGTKKLFAYAAPWLDVLNNGRILVIDELNNSFHSHLVRFLLKLINDSNTNKANGQLIFSTHDTSILDAKLLRRDQIWFIEKDQDKASQLYPLTDFHPRKNEALEKGYLQGRYGALPYIGELRF
jgi:AAA15 family ATPase/GTPase